MCIGILALGYWVNQAVGIVENGIVIFTEGLEPGWIHEGRAVQLVADLTVQHLLVAYLLNGIERVLARALYSAGLVPVVVDDGSLIEATQTTYQGTYVHFVTRGTSYRTATVAVLDAGVLAIVHIAQNSTTVAGGAVARDETIVGAVNELTHVGVAGDATETVGVA